MDVGIYPKNTHAWAKAPAEFLFCKVVKQLYPRSAELAKRPTTVKRSFKYEWAFYASDAFGDPVFVIANALFANWQACWPYKGKHAGLIMHEGTSFLDFVRIVPPPRHGCGETAIGPDILRTIERAAAMTGVLMLAPSNFNRAAITAALAAVVSGFDGAARPLDRRFFDGLATDFVARIAADLLAQLLPDAVLNDAGEIETSPAISGGVFVRLVASPGWNRWRLECLPEAAGTQPEIIAAGTCPADLLGHMICPGARRPDWLSLIGAASLLLHASEDSHE